MHCTQCSHVVTANDKFCAKCGHPVGGTQKAAKAPSRSTGNAESAKQHLAWLAELRAKARRRIFILRALTAFAVFGWPLYWILTEHGTLADVSSYLFAASIWTFFMYTVFASTLSRWSLHPDDYYGLPGAKSDTGEHRCVHCGHNNYYVKGEYASSRRHHSCPRCNNYLFTVFG